MLDSQGQPSNSPRQEWFGRPSVREQADQFGWYSALQEAISDIARHGPERISPSVGADLEPFIDSVFRTAARETMGSCYPRDSRMLGRQPADEVRSIPMRVDDVWLEGLDETHQCSVLNVVGPGRRFDSHYLRSKLSRAFGHGMIAVARTDNHR